ncbi:MAG: D-alanyl-D-alanine carboxypeptidase [Firmicutes bacterium]|nr:D-alanyl-D-alanine carboxypeptidase [Bacillota bacterium]
MKSTKITFIVFLLLFISGIGCAQSVPSLELESAAAILMDYDSGQILFSKNEKDTRVPASLAKVMTLYVAFDQIAAGKADFNDTTQVTEDAWRVGGSQMFLEPRETVTVEQLLLGITVVSGNDACVALAQALAGTEALYVQWMNEKAHALGLNLHFTDVHGLGDSNRVTAEDLAYLVRSYLKDHPQALRFHQQPSFAYQPRSAQVPIEQPNRNGLLRSFEGADGLKTGHLEAAGYNLIGTAVRNNRRLISVVLGARSESQREKETISLLNYGFKNFDLIDISRFLEDKTAVVYKGKEQEVGLFLEEPFLTIPKGIQEGVSISFQTNYVEAPIQKGDEVGVLSVLLNDRPLKESPLLAVKSIERGGFIRIIWDSVVLFLRDLIKRR